MDTSALHNLTRQELFEKVWLTPGIKLAKELGVSDVAIAKRCRKLSVPRPPPGYWARLSAGKRSRRPPLPPSPEELFAKMMERPVPRRLAPPKEASDLIPIAEEFQKAVKSAKLSYDNLVHLDERHLPGARISKAMAWRAAQAVHVLVKELERRGLPLRRSRSSYECGYFEKNGDRLHLTIEEELVIESRMRRRTRGVYGTMADSRVPGGTLVIKLKAGQYGQSEEKKWTDDGRKSQSTMLADMVRFVCTHYIELKRKREAEAIERERQWKEFQIRRKKELEELAIRKQEEAERKHAESLETAKQHREADLTNAARSWRSHQVVTEFIVECEERWLETQAGTLTDGQSNWLTWAQETANGLSPFKSGYPDPRIDGAFDPAAVPFGGPYPPIRKFPQP